MRGFYFGLMLCAVGNAFGMARTRAVLGVGFRGETVGQLAQKQEQKSVKSSAPHGADVASHEPESPADLKAKEDGLKALRGLLSEMTLSEVMAHSHFQSLLREAKFKEDNKQVSDRVDMAKKPSLLRSAFFSDNNRTLIDRLERSEYRSYAGYVDDSGLTDHPVYHERYVREVVCVLGYALHEYRNKYDLEKIADNLVKYGEAGSAGSNLYKTAMQLDFLHADLKTMSSKILQVLKERGDRDILESIQKRRIRKD